MQDDRHAAHDRSGSAGGAEAHAAAAATQVAAFVQARPVLPGAQADALLARVRARQAAVGYEGYASWMARVTPPDAE